LIEEELEKDLFITLFEKRIVGLTDELRGKMDLLSVIFSKIFGK